MVHVRGGNDALPRALSAKLGGRIVLNAAITRIQHSGQAVSVTVARNGKSEKLDADYLCQAAKSRAIAQLPYTSVARVYLQELPFLARRWSPRMELISLICIETRVLQPADSPLVRSSR